VKNWLGQKFLEILENDQIIIPYFDMNSEPFYAGLDLKIKAGMGPFATLDLLKLGDLAILASAESNFHSSANLERFNRSLQKQISQQSFLDDEHHVSPSTFSQELHVNKYFGDARMEGPLSQLQIPSQMTSTSLNFDGFIARRHLVFRRLFGLRFLRECLRRRLRPTSRCELHVEPG